MSSMADALDYEGSDAVLVPRRLLCEVIQDGCCPIHLRLQLSRVVDGSDRSLKSAEVEERKDPEQTDHAEAMSCVGSDVKATWPTAGLSGHRLSAVALYLSLSELLQVRASNREAVQLVMQQRTADGHAEQLRHVHNRIRTRLWMHRIEDVTAGTKDESVFETRLRSLADEALRSRMENEMQDALLQMEEQVRTFQGVVDQRLQEQEQTMKRMVEERVQQELDTILRSEMMKVQSMVEQRVRERVSAIFRQEIQTTVRQLQARLDELVKENALLRDAFAEANLRSKCFFWALNPPPLQTMAAMMSGAPTEILLSLRWRSSLASSYPEISEEL